MDEHKLNPSQVAMCNKPMLTLISRDPRPGIYSIERLFKTLTPALGREYQINDVTLPYRPNSAWRIFRNFVYAWKNSKGIKHVTGDSHYIAILFGKRAVLTIHDCGDYGAMRGLKGIIYRWLWFKLPCKMAGQITVVSQSTKEQLEKAIGPLGPKITVVENCLTLSPRKTKRDFSKIRPKVLQIGTGRHKNLDNLIKAVGGLDFQLHIVGNPSEDLRTMLRDQGVKHEIEFSVSDERLKAVYEECDILFFASRYEGFGLPILEAQANEIPVITSNVLSMPSVAGKGAVLVDPESPIEIRAALEKICHDDCFRNELIANGRENIRRFDPESVAGKYFEIYKRLTGT